MAEWESQNKPEHSNNPNSRSTASLSYYESAVESCTPFLTVLSLLAVSLSLATSSCSELLTRAFTLLFVIVLFAIAVISISISLAGIHVVLRRSRYPKEERYWVFGMACGWFLFACLSITMGSFTILEFKKILLASCKICPEGFRSSIVETDIVKVCGKYLV